MENLKLDYTYALQAGKAIENIFSGNKDKGADELEKELKEAWFTMQNRSGEGCSFLGWLDLPGQITEAELNSIEAKAKELRAKSQVFVCIGIGGSYLGARAIIEAFKPMLSKGLANAPEILYAGHQLGEDYLSELLTYLDTKDYSLCIISKSGTTTEPAVAFRILKAHIEKKYGKQEARTRIVAITDESKGALRKLADIETYTTYVVPDQVGGRYSVLTPVGLFPLSVAGIDIKALVKGALCEQKAAEKAGENMKENMPMQYAFFRQYCYRHGRKIELMVNYEPRLNYFSEWWKQLYGESEGKNRKGLFPASVSFTSDLHSMGQYIQQGEPILLETVLSVEEQDTELKVPTQENNDDGMGFVAGQRLSYINAKAEQATCMAHSQEGGVPVIRIVIPRIDNQSIGRLIYFFEAACGISAYSMGVNPFDQPGVEAYKNNMFKLLGKK